MDNFFVPGILGVILIVLGIMNMKGNILTCVLLVLVVVYLFKPRKGLNTAILNVAGFATAASIMSLLFGFDYITVIGVIITALLAGTFGCGFIKTK